MTETAPVPETPTNPVKAEPAASAAAPASATKAESEGPASGDVVKQEAPKETTAAAAGTAGELDVKPEAAAANAAAAAAVEAGQVKTEGDVKKEEGAAAAAPAGEPDLGKIRGLLEFYFGDHNFRRDKFMQNEAAKDPEGVYCFGFWIGMWRVGCLYVCVRAFCVGP